MNISLLPDILLSKHQDAELHATKSWHYFQERKCLSVDTVVVESHHDRALLSTEGNIVFGDMIEGVRVVRRVVAGTVANEAWDPNLEGQLFKLASCLL